MAKRWTIDSVREEFISRGCELLETEYKNSSTSMRYLANCGHEHKISFENFRQGKGNLCRACRIKSNSKKETKSDEEIRSAFESEGFTVLTPYIVGVGEKVEYIAGCGHLNQIDYRHFSQGGGRVCAKCSRSVRYTYDYVRSRFEEEGCTLLETEYVNCKTKMRYIAKCGHESEITFDAFSNASAAAKVCTECSRQSRDGSTLVRGRMETESCRWRLSVYERDHYTCTNCGDRWGLNAHHIESFGTAPDLRFDTNNGITLCKKCHLDFHGKYGYGRNTREQFQNWKQGNTEVR